MIKEEFELPIYYPIVTILNPSNYITKEFHPEKFCSLEYAFNNILMYGQSIIEYEMELPTYF
jgi:hypothetical protein